MVQAGSCLITGSQCLEVVMGEIPLPVRTRDGALVVCLAGTCNDKWTVKALTDCSGKG